MTTAGSPTSPTTTWPTTRSAATASRADATDGSSLHLPFAPFPASLGPLAASIFAREAKVEGLSQQIDDLATQVAVQVAATNTAYAAWQSAVTASNDAASKAADAAASEYEQNAELGPLSRWKEDIQQLNLLAPGILPAPTNAGPQAVNLTEARQAEQTAYATYTSSLTAQENLQAEQSSLQLTFETENSELTQLKSDNAAALAAAEATQEQIDSTIGSQLPLGTDVAGQGANPAALKAISFAMAQLGKPYVFGAEGPNTYDCSGLVWASYRFAGVTVPRIARDQYHGTTPISVNQLLPGDLVFFSTTSNTDWHQITHVGMYIGDGKMIEAPMTGETVKIAPVWWSAFFGATRVVPAVKRPSPTPTASPSPSPSKSPSPSPSKSPSPSPSHSPSPSPSPSPSSPAPSSSSPSPSASGSGSGSASASASASAPPPSNPSTPAAPSSASASASPSGSPSSVSPSGSSAAEPAVSPSPSAGG